MAIQLSDHFDYRKLLRFTLPSIVMMVFSSIYSVVDGIFVSNFVGKTAFASINLIYPFLMILGTIGYMIGTGGAALVAKTLGEGRRDEANRIFSLLIFSLLVFSIVLALGGLLFLRDIALLLGAEGTMADSCVAYGSILLPMLPAMTMQYAFQPFLVAAGKPSLGLYITVAAGVSNIILDALFIIGFGWGLQGAAIATAIAQTIGGLLPLAYFLLPNKSSLRLGKTGRNYHPLLKACTNGMSEFLSNISMSVVAMTYNFQLMRYAGENGVAAFGVIQYANFIFLSVFLGYSIGTAPIIGYNHGAGNYEELHNMYHRSLRVIGMTGILLFLLAETLSLPLATIFVGYDAGLLSMTYKGFMLYGISFLLAGFNLYASSFFTALNNGIVSAAISFSRTMVCEIAAVILLPMILGINGIWLAITLAEIMALCLSIYFMRHLKKTYKY